MVRIATTPSPFIYRHLVVTLTFVYVFTFPIGFVSVLGSSVIPFSAAIAAGFYGVMHLSKELENPYGWDFNDIDLASFQQNLHEDMTTIHACTFGALPAATGGPGRTALSPNANVFANTSLGMKAAFDSEAAAVPSHGADSADKQDQRKRRASQGSARGRHGGIARKFNFSRRAIDEVDDGGFEGTDTT